MEVASPWFRIIWLFVALGECLGIVPAHDDPFLSAVHPDRKIHAPVVVELPDLAGTPNKKGQTPPLDI